MMTEYNTNNNNENSFDLESVGGMTTSTLDLSLDNNEHDQLPSVEQYKSNMSNNCISPMEKTMLEEEDDDYEDEESNNHHNNAPVGGVHDQLPSLEEYKTTANPQPKASGYSKCCIFFSVLVMVGLILTAILVPIAITKKNNGTYGSLIWAASRHDVVVDYLVNQGISNRIELEQPGTPQYQASKWIADQDLYRMELPTDTGGSVSKNNNKSRFVERYILATLYYSLKGEGWMFNMNFLSATDHCLWNDNFVTSSGLKLVLGVTDCENTDDDEGDTGGYYVTKIAFPINNLKGEIPAEMGYLHRLHTFSAPFNEGITGTLKDSWKNLSHLKDLSLQYCNLSGSIPDWLGGLDKLTSLGLGNNRFKGPMPDSFFDLTRLQFLGLDDNLLEGDIQKFSKLIHLEELYLEDNAFTGTFTEAMTLEWKSMKELDWSTNEIESTIPSNLWTTMTDLEILDLHGNKFHGSIPELQDKVKALTFLSFYDNELDGTIPASISHLVNLEHLDLSRNHLELTIPTTIGNLTRLGYLFVGNNDYEEQKFPEFLTQLTKLGELSLKSSNLVGTIPPSIGNFSSLQLLDLDSNQLTGSIPEEFGKLRKVDHVLLNRNRLNGTLPKSMGQMGDLDIFVIDNNAITGSADVICKSLIVKPDYFVADCSDPDPEITCSCCQLCCHDSDEACNNVDWHVNLDPIWEYGYQRAIYLFSQEALPAP